MADSGTASPAPYLARSAIAVTAYRPLVFNSTTSCTPPRMQAARAGSTLPLAFDTPARAMTPPHEQFERGQMQTSFELF